jgi:hypothetical protein
MSNKKSIIICLNIMVCLLLASCAVTRSNFIEVNKVAITPKECASVEYFAIKPRRAALCIGYVQAHGNEFSNHEDIIMEAKSKAAEIGGDFIIGENAGTESETVFIPGYTTYQTRDASQKTSSGYSVGPSVSTNHFPWGRFSVWVYKKAILGIEYDCDRIINGFTLKSDAEAAGIHIGDKIIGIDGFDWHDEGLAQHVIDILPGDRVTMNLLHNGKRVDCTITALSN